MATAADDDPRADAVDPHSRRIALWVLAVQCLLALSWTMYVLFLPAMLSSAGIDKRWFVYVLIADQAIFAACDWIAGVYADRVALAWRRLGRVVTAVTLLSSAALLAMPWIANGGNAPLLLAIIFLWAATSSALRAPVFALLGRVRQAASPRRRRAGLVSLALVGISLAGAIGPYVTLLLKTVDPRLPIAISAASLAAAGLWALRADAALPQPGSLRDEPVAGDRRRVWSLAAVVLIASFGTQLFTAIVAQPLLQRFVGADALLWAAWFWVGFAIGLVPGARIAGGARPLTGAAVVLAIGIPGLAFAGRIEAFAVLVGCLCVAGAAWGVFTTTAFTLAVSLSNGRATVRGAGTASGMLFSATAIASLARLALVASGHAKADIVSSLPAVAWFVAALLLGVVGWTLWRRPRAS